MENKDVLGDVMTCKYEAFLDKGRLAALDLDSGDIYIVKLNGRRVFSTLKDEECPYEIFEANNELYCLNTETSEVNRVELIKS
jgi:hypothetical protein